MSSVLIRTANSKWSIYQIVLTGLGALSSRPKSYLKLRNCRKSKPRPIMRSNFVIRSMDYRSSRHKTIWFPLLQLKCWRLIVSFSGVFSFKEWNIAWCTMYSCIIYLKHTHTQIYTYTHKYITNSMAYELGGSMPHSQELCNNPHTELNHPNSSFWYLFL